MIHLLNSRRNVDDDPNEDLPSGSESQEDSVGGYYYDDATGYEIFLEDEEEDESSRNDTASD